VSATDPWKYANINRAKIEDIFVKSTQFGLLLLPDLAAASLPSTSEEAAQISHSQKSLQPWGIYQAEWQKSDAGIGQ
jgi:hypothetical protein